MSYIKKIHLPEWLTAGAAFAYYFIMALYKLTQTPIWQDEAMEFYCSLPVKGAIRGVTQYATMYERMAKIQQQPPLYNWLMCLWLQISEDEWWYRFSSVLMVFGAAVGLYFIIRRLCNRYLAAFCVIIFSSIYIIMYYVKEASEYALLLMFLFWLIYAYVLICENVTVKRIVAFTVLCVLSVYTHYGAVFAVVPMALSVVIMMFRQKEWRNLKAALLLDVSAVIFGGIPLVRFFLIPQSANQVSTLFGEREIIIENGNIIGDIIFSISSVFRWCVLDIDRDTEKIGFLVDLAGLVILAVIIFVAVKTGKKVLRSFLWCNIAVFTIYYVITKLNLYAYGWYGNRYNMFIFPLWFVLIAVSLYEFAVILKRSDKKAVFKAAYIIQAGMILACVLYCAYGDYRVSNHWWKMDLRTVVNKWYGEEGYNVPTLLDFHQRYAFVYYFTHNEQYDEQLWEKIKWNEEIETYSTNLAGIWQKYIYEIYGGELPDELYLVTGQYNVFVKAFEEFGYDVTAEVDTTAKLYHMVFDPDKPQVLEFE